MCRAWVFEAWPLGGTHLGGTMLFLRTAGADLAIVRRGITFSFGADDVRMVSRNTTFHSSQLVGVVTPPIPPSVGLLPRTARLYFACYQNARQRDRVQLGAHIATFAYWLTRPQRLPRCFDGLNCDRPPALFDQAAGFSLSRPLAARMVGRPMPRILPPGAKCTDWRALRAVQGPYECQRIAQLLTARWEGISSHSRGFGGCTLWRQGRGRTTARYVKVDGTSMGCDITKRGGHCVCLGANAARPLDSPCGRSLSALFGRRKDLGHATSTLHDPCEGRGARPCLAKILRQMPAPEMHEFEDPSIVSYYQDAVGTGSKSFTFHIVIALHSFPIIELLEALRGVLDAKVRTTVWVYQKGQLSQQERRRLHAYKQLVVRFEKMANVGRCDHSYLTHITRNFNHLADVTLFVKDTTLAHTHLGYGSKLLTFVSRLPSPIDFWGARSLMRATPDFEMESYVSDICRNKFVNQRRGRACYTSDKEYVRAEQRPLSTWRAHHGIPNGSTFKFVPGGIFAASAGAIRRTPLSVYNNLLSDVGRGSNVESGHFMERSWFAVFSGAEKHRTVTRMRIRLAVYTVDLTTLARPSISPAPCNKTFALKTAGRSVIDCIYFAANQKMLDSAESQGWKTQRIRSASEAHVLKRAPHLHNVIASYDYSAYHTGASAGLVLNVPSVLEAIGGKYLTSSGASMALLSPFRDARIKAQITTSLSTAAIVRRHTHAVARIGELWLNASGPLPMWSDLQQDDETLHKVLSAPQTVRRHTSVVLPADDESTSDGPSSMLISARDLPVWWSWWTCIAKGHGSVDQGRGRISRCCKPGALEIQPSKALAQN